MTEISDAMQTNNAQPSATLVNATLVWAMILPAAMVVPGILGIGQHSVALANTISMVSLVSLSSFSYFIARKWNLGGLLRAIVVVFPIAAFTYWSAVGSTIPFGDNEALSPMIDQAAVCWSEQPISGLCFLQSAYDSRYVVSSIYHGLRISMLGDSPIATVSWGCATLLSVAFLALPGMCLSGLSRTHAGSVSFGLLLWPDFLDMTSWLGRDLIILWAVVAWFSGIRMAVIRRGLLGIPLVLIAVTLVAFSRPIYLPICALDLASLLFIAKRAKTQQGGFSSLRYLVLLIGSFLLVSVWLDSSLLGFIKETTAAQALAAGQELGTTASSNLGGSLSALTGIGYFVSIPVRLVISTVAPFPWTSPEIFNQRLGGYNGKWIALAVHIIKSELGIAGLLFIPTCFWMTLRRYGMKSLMDNSCLPLCLGLLIAAGAADAGYSRYVAVSYPFVVGMIIHSSRGTEIESQFNRYLARTVFLAVFGTILVLLIYEIGA